MEFCFFCSIGLAGQAHVFLLVLEKHNNPSVLQSFLPLQEFLASYLNMVTFLCKKKACSHALQVCCGQCKKERKKEKAYWMSVYTCQGKDCRSGKQGVEMRSREMQNSIKTVKMCRAQQLPFIVTVSMFMCCTCESHYKSLPISLTRLTSLTDTDQIGRIYIKG